MAPDVPWADSARLVRPCQQFTQLADGELIP